MKDTSQIDIAVRRKLILRSLEEAENVTEWTQNNLEEFFELFDDYESEAAAAADAATAAAFAAFNAEDYKDLSSSPRRRSREAALLRYSSGGRCICRPRNSSDTWKRPEASQSRFRSHIPYAEACRPDPRSPCCPRRRERRGSRPSRPAWTEPS